MPQQQFKNDISTLLEQHDRYELGLRWAVSRNTDRWNVYYCGKHVDAWRMEASGASLRKQIDAELTSYATAIEAIKAAEVDMEDSFFE
jgi:hypothetical protein